MTLKYSFFGIPGNEDEFEVMIRKKGLALNITFEEISEDNGIGLSFDYQCFPVLKAGRKKLSLKKNFKKLCIRPRTSQITLEQLAMQEEVYNKIFRIAYSYQRKGVRVTISSIAVEEAVKNFDEYYLETRKRIVSEA